MTLEQYEALPAIDKLRRAVKAFGYCNESFLQRFNTVALLQIHKAWCLSDWDFLPDCWTNQQIRDAILNGIPPKWDDQERPVYTHD